MRKDDCFQLGHISRLHGYKGEIIAVLDTDRPEAYEIMESVLLESRGELIPFFIEALSRNSKGHFILKFEEIENEAQARKLIGTELWMPLAVLPALEGKNFYYHEVIGFTMVHNGVAFGICTELIDHSAQPLFKVEDENGNEILVPAINEFIISINREERSMDLNLPAGLLELYQSEDEAE
jgi:16S rRNA processing protein RimM